MKRYSLNQTYPTTLPHRIRLSDGTVRTDSDSFTEDELADAGYVEAPPEPTIEYPKKLDWIGTDWLVRDPNEQETEAKWHEIQSKCQQLLAETDYKVIKAYEAGAPVDPTYVSYRQQLRDLYNKVGYDSPWFITWPQKPTEE